ncbi:hypothetical protein LAZ67_8000935 [Cordylochernes scorpioides]|uniref:Transposase n=1 Tax=Cordylochernes scorpioides TaxID=51811 RepID=A0ABY6KPS9_9ARAC|nr:hypothetical protein LAZ67_8000935 [Cordylochernes scorpioides]
MGAVATLVIFETNQNLVKYSKGPGGTARRCGRTSPLTPGMPSLQDKALLVNSFNCDSESATEALRAFRSFKGYECTIFIYYARLFYIYGLCTQVYKYVYKLFANCVANLPFRSQAAPLAVKMGENASDIFETIKIKVCRYADTFREKVVRELQMEKEKGQLFSLTLDEWTSIRSKRYLNINIHSRTKVWNLGLTRISGVYTSEQCKYVICAKLLEFGIDFETDIVCVTTDGCAMMVKLVQIIGPLQQLCYAHGLHLAVKMYFMIRKKERVVPEFVSATVNEAESDLSEDNNEDTSPFNVSLKVAHPSFPGAMYPQSLVFSKKNINEVTKKARVVVTCGHVIGTI